MTLAFVSRLRETGAAVDPALQLHQLRTAGDVQRERQRSLLAIALVGLAVPAHTGLA